MGRSWRRKGGLVAVVCALVGWWAAPAWAQATDTLEASDQAVQNGSITVASVTLLKDGWVVAAMDAGGQPGTTIGQTAVKGGTPAKNVAVALKGTVAPGSRVWLSLHTDAGTIGTFEFPGADAPIRVNGKPVTVRITITAAANGATPASPSQLPQTGGEPGILWVALLASLLMLAGSALLRVRRSA